MTNLRAKLEHGILKLTIKVDEHCKLCEEDLLRKILSPQGIDKDESLVIKPSTNAFDSILGYHVAVVKTADIDRLGDTH